MNLWKEYKDALHDAISLHNGVGNVWANWESKGTTLLAKTYTNKYLIKSREVEIWSDTSCIYNNILYPKTSADVPTGLLPCFGMDLMAFNEKRVIIVFDFQHPVENFLFGVDSLPKSEKDYRFFEKGNHFSENIFVKYCKMEEVNAYLSTFKEYLTVYKSMIELGKPKGTDTSVYKDFDAYMTRLDPVGGYLTGKFGKEKANKLVNEFLFPYG
tara:strand:+ start:205 stop:843 length:639 start_codon:yes stop_codon:yes gene_type:complete